MRITTWGLLVSLGLSGCYKDVAIRKDQLPQLNGSYQRATGAVRTTSGTVYTGEITVAHVAAPDGRNVEIKGEFDATVVASGKPVTFEHPVTSTIEGSTLTVAGENRAATKFDLEQVTAVSVSQYDATASSLAYVGGGLTVGAIIGLVALAVIGH